MKHKILVTGGAGFIGSHVTDALIERGHNVVVYDSLEPQVHESKPSWINPSAKFVQANILDYETLKENLAGINVVFHFASAVGIGQSMYEIRKYSEANVMGTANLMEALSSSEHDVKKIIFSSSMSIYGEGAYKCEICNAIHHSFRRDAKLLAKRKWEPVCTKCGSKLILIPTSEKVPVDPVNVYAISKNTQEQLIRSVSEAQGIPYTMLRFFNVYGPRQSLKNPYTGVASVFMSQLKEGNSPIIYEDGLQTRDFVSVKDIVQANMLALESNSANNEIFNVGSGNPVSIKVLAEILASIYKVKKTPEITNKFRKGDTRHCIADISKIKSKLNYKPTILLDDGMKEFVEWASKSKSKDKVSEAHSELKKRGMVS